MTDFTHQDPVLCHWSETCRLWTSSFDVGPGPIRPTHIYRGFLPRVPFLVPSQSAEFPWLSAADENDEPSREGTTGQCFHRLHLVAANFLA
jgi:hypothetical protein